MKKIFWTSIFCLGIIALFWAYVRLFDPDLGGKVAHLFNKEIPIQTSVISTGKTITTPVLESLDALNAKIDLAANKIAELKTQEAESATSQLTSTSASTVVKLYYFNEKEDKLLPIEQQASPASLSPIFRTVPQTDNIIRDTISLLLQGALTDSEFKDGFTSSFVRAVRLVDASLNANGVLSLTFSKAPGANIGWSAFIGILTNAIIKTAQQFPQVKSVNLLPEELFQP